MNKARIVRFQLVDQSHQRSHRATHRDQTLGALKVAGQAFKIGGELLACPRGSGSKLAACGWQRREKPLRHAAAANVQRARPF